MKIYFNSLGVITNTDTTGDSLRQGSVGVQLKAYFDEIENTNYTATLNFKRSDNSMISNVIMSLSSDNPELYEYTFEDAWFFAKAGVTTLTIFLHDASGNVVAGGQVQFNIEATDYDGEPTITINQYNSLVALIQSITGLDNIETINEISEHLLDKENPHEVTKSQVGLGNVSNTGDSDIPIENGTQKFTTGGAYRMQQAIDSLSSAGRFLSLWDATTGKALSDPPTTPIYQYQAGDYFRVSVVGDKVPTGTQYDTEGTNYTTAGTPVVVGDVFYFDGTVWVLQSGSGAGTVLDVKINGNSIVIGGIANILGSTLLDMLYPVGSIYMSLEQDEETKDTDGKYGCKLANLGGTWARLEDRFLVGASSTYVINTTGGEATHTLTVAEMPSHTHTQNSHTHTQAAHRHSLLGGKSNINLWSANAISLKHSSSKSACLAAVELTPSSDTNVYQSTNSNSQYYVQTTTPTINGTTATNNNTGGGQAHNNLPPYLAVYMWKRIG